MPREVHRRSSASRTTSLVECLARDERGVSRPATTLAGRVPREGRARCIETTSEVYRDPPLANPVSIRSLALATRPPSRRWSSASRGTSEVYRDHERGVPRPATGEPGLDTLAGARYSTTEPSLVDCLARSIGGRVPREGRARCIETTSEVYRDRPPKTPRPATPHTRKAQTPDKRPGSAPHARVRTARAVRPRGLFSRRPSGRRPRRRRRRCWRSWSRRSRWPWPTTWSRWPSSWWPA